MAMTQYLPIKWLHRTLALIAVIWFFLAFSGYDYLPILHDSYDTWRFYQIAILALFGAGFLLLPIKTVGTLGKLPYYLTAVLIGFMVLALFGVKNVTAYLTYGIGSLLLMSGLYAGTLFRYDAKWMGNLFALLALAPLPVMIRFITNIIMKMLIPDGDMFWHDTFENIRYLDDVLLPALAILWLRPGFLSAKKWTPWIILLSTLYIFNLFMDGARSALLSLGLALLMIALFGTNKKSALKIPLISLLLGFLLYITINAIVQDAHELVRTSSSGRTLLYSHALKDFLAHPIFGIGGSNYKGWQGYYASHPHSFIFHWMAEFGLIGVLFLVGFFFTALKLFLRRKLMPCWIWAAPAMVSMNALFSGAFVYPLSQFISVLIFAYAFHLYLATFPLDLRSINHGKRAHTPTVKISLNYPLLGMLLLKSLTFMALCTTLYMTVLTLPHLQRLEAEQKVRFEEWWSMEDSFRYDGPSLWQRNPIILFDGTQKIINPPKIESPETLETKEAP